MCNFLSSIQIDLFCKIFEIDFKKSFQVHSKNEWKIQNSYIPPAPPASSTVNSLLQFMNVGHYHVKSVLFIRVHCFVHSMNFDKCIMACINHVSDRIGIVSLP